jgi:reelin
MIDRFEDTNKPSSVWDRVHGGGLGTGCGDIGGGNALYFDGAGSREARTVPLDTRRIK